MAGTKGIKDYSKIYYDPETKFKIIPSLPQEVSEQLVEFISEMQDSHSVFSHGESTRHSFFWTIDPESSTIIIDETTDMVENNIFEQFNLIANWLFERGYNLSGCFICRTNKKVEPDPVENRISVPLPSLSGVECIFSNGIMKSISHYSIVDDHSTENVSAIIEQAKQMMIKVIELDHNLGTTNSETRNGIAESIKNLQYRIDFLENIPKSQNYISKIIIMGAFGLGFLYAYLIYSCSQCNLEQYITDSWL